MNNNHPIATIIFLILLSFCSCKKEKERLKVITFDVGFEDFKQHQGICINHGKEEIYFYKRKFNPQIRFYDLEGNLKDSISLKTVVDRTGGIGKLSVVSKDTMIALAYKINQLVGIKRDGSFLFRIDLDSLSALKDEVRYHFNESFIPTPNFIGDNVFFVLMWHGSHKNEYQPTSYLDYYKHILLGRLHSPMVAKMEAIYTGSPRIKFGLRDHYYNKSHELISYGGGERNFAILNNKLFFIIANERNIYELDVNTLNVIDTIPVVPQKYDIPAGIKLIGKQSVSEDMMAEQELKDKCRVVNMLHSPARKQYYIFLKTGKDLGSADELGYPFRLYIYDESFTKKKEYAFDTDRYNPRSAMMTSKGIMIEQINEKPEYGKKTFEFIDL